MIEHVNADDAYQADYQACQRACDELEAEGFFEEAAKKYGLTLRSHINSQAESGEVAESKGKL